MSILLVGLSGSGKTYFARQHYPKYQHLHSELYNDNAELKNIRNTPERLNKRNDIFMAHVDFYCSHEQTIIEATPTTAKRIINRLGVSVFEKIIFLFTDTQTAAEICYFRLRNQKGLFIGKTQIEAQQKAFIQLLKIIKDAKAKI